MSVRPSKTSVARSRNRRVDHSALGRACGAVLGTFEALERRVLMTAAPVIVYPFEDSPTGTTVEDTSVEGSDNDGTLKGDNAGVYSGTNPLVDDPSLYPVFMPASGTGADSPSPAGGQFMRFSGDNAFNGAGSRVQTQDFLVHLLSHLAYHLGQLDYHRRVVTGENRSIGALPVTELGDR